MILLSLVMRMYIFFLHNWTLLKIGVWNLMKYMGKYILHSIRWTLDVLIILYMLLVRVIMRIYIIMLYPVRMFMIYILLLMFQMLILRRLLFRSVLKNYGYLVLIVYISVLLMLYLKYAACII